MRELDRHAESVLETSPNVLNLQRQVTVRFLRDDSSGVGDSAPCGLSGSAHCVPKSGTIRQLDRRIGRPVYSFVRLLCVREISVCLSFVTKLRVLLTLQSAGTAVSAIASRRDILSKSYIGPENFACTPVCAFLTRIQSPVCLSFATKRRVVVGSHSAGSDAARIASRRRVL